MKYHWIRFSDNIYVYCKNKDQAQNVFNHLNKCIPRDYSLQINIKKSGIYDVFQRVMLGYDFLQAKSGIEIRKHKYDTSAVYHNWRQCKVQKVNREYHIVEEGILTKKDYTLLFENDIGKFHIPVEVVDQLNFYSDVTITPNVFHALDKHNIKLSFFDKHGVLIGTYLPSTFDQDANMFIKQVQIYNNETERLALAKKMEIKSSISPKIGVVHATNRRSCSLNLDFADIFKPVIVDRVIFSLVNCHQLRREEHFEGTDDGAVLLNKSGKKIFLQEFQNKLETHVNYKGKGFTYQGLMIEEVKLFGQYVAGNNKYSPYKYY